MTTTGQITPAGTPAAEIEIDADLARGLLAAQHPDLADLTITAVASPSPTNILYPGGTGDVVVTITNPNAFPVTITALNLPTNTTYATGYTTSSLTTRIDALSHGIDLP